MVYGNGASTQYVPFPFLMSILTNHPEYFPFRMVYNTWDWVHNPKWNVSRRTVRPSRFALLIKKDSYNDYEEGLVRWSASISFEIRVNR